MGKTIGTYTKEYGQLRFIVEDDDLLVCVTDVARSLGYKRPNDAIRDHCLWPEKRTVPKMDGSLEYARFVDWFEALEFVGECCLPGADVYEKFLRALIDKYCEEYTSFSSYDDFDFDDYDEEDEDDDCDFMDENDPDYEDDEYDKETEILAVSKFVVLLVGMIIDVLENGGWFAFNDQEPGVERQKTEIANSLSHMMDIADDVLAGVFDAA